MEAFARKAGVPEGKPRRAKFEVLEDPAPDHRRQRSTMTFLRVRFELGWKRAGKRCNFPLERYEHP
jgi:hypothetical protein